MSANTISFQYEFRSLDGSSAPAVFDILLDAETLSHIRQPIADPPPWTRLDGDACASCPLHDSEEQHCPVALSLVDLVDRFDSILSHEEMIVTVTTDRRTYSATTTVQQALSSLIGLYMATSGCPPLNILKPMARFHLPFATRQETVFRAAGSYLLAQYFKAQRGEEADLELKGLGEAYQRIHEINMSMAKRLRHVSSGDANMNAIVVLDLFAQGLPMTINSNLSDIEHILVGAIESD